MFNFSDVNNLKNFLNIKSDDLNKTIFIVPSIKLRFDSGKDLSLLKKKFNEVKLIYLDKKKFNSRLI